MHTPHFSYPYFTIPFLTFYTSYIQNSTIVYQVLYVFLPFLSFFYSLCLTKVLHLLLCFSVVLPMSLLISLQVRTYVDRVYERGQKRVTNGYRTGYQDGFMNGSLAIFPFYCIMIAFTISLSI